jgi:hypothetical protein
MVYDSVRDLPESSHEITARGGAVVVPTVIPIGLSDQAA